MWRGITETQQKEEGQERFGHLWKSSSDRDQITLHNLRVAVEFLNSAAQSKKALEERKKTMKKLMFGMAVAAAGLAFGLESANVVGYDSVTLRTGMKAAGAAFVPIVGANVDLQSLRATGYDTDEGYGDGDIAVQTLDP